MYRSPEVKPLCQLLPSTPYCTSVLAPSVPALLRAMLYTLSSVTPAYTARSVAVPVSALKPLTVYTPVDAMLMVTPELLSTL